MSKKIIIFDIDGTLVDDEKNLPEETKESIDQLQKNGAYVVIATGRPPFLFKELRTELNINSYISFNGQHVVFEGEVVYKNPIKRNELTALYEMLKVRNKPMVFMDEYKMVATEKEHPYIQKCFEMIADEYPIVDLDFHLHRPVYQALLFCEEEKEIDFTNDFPVFDFLRWHKNSYDILPTGGSKAVGVHKIIEVGQFYDAQTFAFGDGANDMEMIQEVDVGIAMGNAVPQLKKVADFITDNVEDQGLIKAIKHFNLI